MKTEKPNDHLPGEESSSSLSRESLKVSLCFDHLMQLMSIPLQGFKERWATATVGCPIPTRLTGNGLEKGFLWIGRCFEGISGISSLEAIASRFQVLH